MRYIGNKERLVDNIYSLMVKHNISGKSFFDFFAGTANVGKYFKCKNYQVYSSDLLYLSYVLQKAYIENNNEPDFRELIKILKIREVQLFTCNLNHVILYLNSLEGKSGFIYDNYTVFLRKKAPQYCGAFCNVQLAFRACPVTARVLRQAIFSW